jgi:hypothetical protein
MLFGEMDSDSMDVVVGEEEEEQQHHEPQYGGSAAGAGSFSMFGGDVSSHGRFGPSAASREVNTAASGAGAARGRSTAGAAGVPASSWLVGSQRQPGRQQQQQQQGGSSMLVDDDELARQVAAQMARHRNKRMRASQSRSQMG